MRKYQRMMGTAALVAMIVTAAACNGCTASPQIAAHAKQAGGQLGRVNVLIDQCSVGSQDPASCAEAKGGVNAVGESLTDIQKAAQ